MVLASLVLLQAAWKPFTLGGFTFHLPKKPLGDEETRIWMENVPGGTVFIETQDVDPRKRANPDGVMANAAFAEMDLVDGKLLEQRDILVNGWPGLDVRYTEDAKTFDRSRYIVVGDTLVMLLVKGPKAPAVDAAFAKLTSGLNLKAKGPLAAPGPRFARVPLGASGASVEMPKPPREDAFPLTRRPNSPVLHRFTALYGNRSYFATYAEVPAVKDADLPHVLERLNANALESNHATKVSSKDATLAGGKGLLAVGDVKGLAAVLAESTYRDGRVYTLVAVVPTAWRGHPEPRRFFASFRVGR